MNPPFLKLDHLQALCDDTGLIEHALLGTPRRDSGYTTDDNGRMLAVLARADLRGLGGDSLEETGLRLSRVGLAYLQHASIADEHGFRNRLSYDRRWLDERGSDDSYGRALWGLGTLAARSLDSDLQESAYGLFWANYELESPHSRSAIYAILGATEVAAIDDSGRLLGQVARWLGQLPGPSRGPWLWPEPSLTYDNARYPEALIAAGKALSDDNSVARGLELLTWLVEIETAPMGGHFSWTPVGGRTPDNLEPGFDQQPLEAWAMMDAATVAASVNGPRWYDVAEKARSWFLGLNDLGVDMVDPVTGAGFDGLTATGPNENRGAESTLAAVAAMSGAAAGAQRV
jgi:hypothetical protein